MNILNASIITLATGLSSCSMIKSTHHVVIDHNININVNNFAVDINHKYPDGNRTDIITSDSLNGLTVDHNVERVLEADNQ